MDVAHKTVGVGTAKHTSDPGLGQRVRVFIGTEPKTEIARKVLEFSIRRRTNAEVEFTPMIGRAWEYDATGIQVGTGFSLRRWKIPEMCRWHGRAIYVDSDTLVFDDIYKLYVQPDLNPIQGCAAWMTYQPSKFSAKPHPQSSVMVIDCQRAEALPYFHLDRVLEYLKNNPDRKHYVGIMFPDWMKPMPGVLPTEWNHLNVYKDKVTKLLHYTKEPEQPWYKPDHPYAARWQMEFQAALGVGYITPEEVVGAVDMYGVKEDWRSTNGLHPHYLEFLPEQFRKKHKLGKKYGKKQ